MIDVLIPVYNQEKLIQRALDSIPDGCNIIVCDDGSTDNTIKQINREVTLLKNTGNMGVGFTLKRLYDAAKSDYIVQLDSDDYFLPGITDVIKQLDGTDLVFYDINYSDGRKRHINRLNVHKWVGNGKFIRRDFLGDIRPLEVRIHEDQHVHKALLAKNPTMKFTNIPAYCYDKRVGSLTWEFFNRSKI